MVIEIAFRPVAGFDLQPEAMRKLTDWAAVVQRGLFCAPIYFPGTFWLVPFLCRSGPNLVSERLL